MKRANILVVDDNEELAENLCELLADIDEFEVETHAVSDAAAAIEFANPTLDLALIDVHLPDGDGIKMIGQLKEQAPYVEVVVITGDSSIESAIAAVSEGAFSYVLKPFQPIQLRETAALALKQATLLRDRERLERELKASERRHRGVVENVPAFVLALDETGRIALWNRHLEEVTGYSREEMLGQRGEELVGDAGDQRLPLKNNGHRLVRWRRAIVVEPFGERLTYALGVDVTDEREMLLRTMQSERLAAVGTLAAGLAHEVRNPLNSATLQLQVLERRLAKGADEDSLKRVIGLVRNEIHRLDNLVNDFLAFARPVPMQLEQVDVDSVVGAVLELVGPEARQQRTTLHHHQAEQAPIIRGDAERMRQVLLNLIRNALEALEGNGHIHLRTQVNSDRVVLEVEDDGPGIQDVASVFDAFFTTKEKGTGLGLAIVHRIIREHGGEVEVRSRSGSTVFHISLPLAGTPVA